MEKQELVDLLDGLNWHQAGKWGFVKLIDIELAPKVKFDIAHHNYNRKFGSGNIKKVGFIDQWNVGFVIHGCESGLVFDTPEQVKIYMLNQYDKLVKYLTLIGKREKLTERIAPLRRKWDKYAETIFELAKTL